MAPDFDRFARMPWPIDCWASSGIKLLSSAFAFSCVGTATIYRIEKSSAGSTGYVSTLSRIQAAFENAGVVFIDDDGSAGFGVRLAKTKKKRKR